jgi:hypothetical protein
MTLALHSAEQVWALNPIVFQTNAVFVAGVGWTFEAFAHLVDSLAVIFVFLDNGINVWVILRVWISVKFGVFDDGQV